MSESPGQDGFPAVAGEGLGPGSLVAGYRLEGQVGRGGMAVVFRARDEHLVRTVALKVLAPALAADEGFRQRFVRESRAAAAVDDPHIIPVFEAGESGGVLFIAMRFVSGGDVRSLVRQAGPLPAGRAVGIISPVAAALDAAHDAGLVHRDVKPANMLLDARPGRPDHVYLSDFGLSKGAVSSTGLTGSGLFLGTPDYVAPEQIAGRVVDGRADQYALACAAFELLSGEPPFPRDHGMAVIYAHSSEPPPALTSRQPGLPLAVDAVLGRALAKEPAERYTTCREFADALRGALGLPRYDTGPGTRQGTHPTTVVTPAWPAVANVGAADAGGTGTHGPAPGATLSATPHRALPDRGGQHTADGDVPAGPGQPEPAAVSVPGLTPELPGSRAVGRHHRLAPPAEIPTGAATAPRSGSRGRRRAGLAAAGAVVLIAGIAGSLAVLTHGPAPSQHAQPSNSGSGEAHPFAPIPGHMNAVAAGPGSTAWAIGARCPSPSRCSIVAGGTQPLVLLRNGSAWSRIPIPGPVSGLTGVTAGPGGTAWALGAFCSAACNSPPSIPDIKTLILHWNGSAWSRVPIPAYATRAELVNISAGPDGTAWAIGTSCRFHCSSPIPPPLVLRWNGSAWSRVPIPAYAARGYLSAVSAGPSGTAWAVGYTCTPDCSSALATDQTLILHWNGSAWSQVSPRDNGVLGWVSTGPGGTAWAVGNLCSPTCTVSHKPLILHWNGFSWSRVPTPASVADTGLSLVSSGPGGTAWAIGTRCPSNCSSSSAAVTQSVILHWNGSAWSRIPLPGSGNNTLLDGVSAGPGGTAWAVGGTCTRGCANFGAKTLILHWNGSTWSPG